MNRMDLERAARREDPEPYQRSDEGNGGEAGGLTFLPERTEHEKKTVLPE